MMKSPIATVKFGRKKTQGKFFNLCFSIIAGLDGTRDQTVANNTLDVRECCILDAGGLC